MRDTVDPMTAHQTIQAAPNGAPSTQLQRMELLFIWGFWALIAMLMSMSTLLNPASFPRGSSSVGLWPPLLASIVESALWAILTPFIFRLAKRLTLDHPQWLLRLIIMVAIGALMAEAMYQFMGQFRRAERWAIDLFLGEQIATEPADATQFTYRLWRSFEFVVFLVILVAGIAKDYMSRYRLYQERYAELRVELLNARLRALQDQLNPHFLFNTLNAISSLVVRDPDKAQDMLALLSDLLRDTLESKDLEVRLSHELQFISRYLDIMHMRFGDRMETRQDIAPEALYALVPNLILQPLVENAIKHGIDRLDGQGRITISAAVSDHTLILRVIDNGEAGQHPASSATQRSGPGVGLSNTRERLRQTYGEQQSLQLHTAEQGGTIAEIRLPYRTSPLAGAN
ncbi:MAG: histidine kinase [Steroidobacteraceae bacterium]